MVLLGEEIVHKSSGQQTKNELALGQSVKSEVHGMVAAAVMVTMAIAVAACLSRVRARQGERRGYQNYAAALHTAYFITPASVCAGGSA